MVLISAERAEDGLVIGTDVLATDADKLVALEDNVLVHAVIIHGLDVDTATKVVRPPLKDDSKAPSIPAGVARSPESYE